MKYVFLGSGLIAKSCLEEVIRSGNECFLPCGIVSDETNLSLFDDRSMVKKIQLGDREKQHEANRMIEEIDPDFIVSVQYPWILPSAILDIVPNRAFNIHNAKLPDYRGHNSLTYEILNRETTHTSTLHIMDQIVDRGRTVRTEVIKITSCDTAFSLWQRSAQSCITLFNWLVIAQNYKLAHVNSEPIVGSGTYYGKYQINSDKEIPPDSDIDTICRFSRAFYFPPHEPAYLMSGKMKIYVTPEFMAARSLKN